MTDRLKEFKEEIDGLQGVLRASGSKNSDLPQERGSYRNAAAKLASDFSKGSVVITDTTPDHTVDSAYSQFIPALQERAQGYFHEHKSELVNEAPEGKLADALLDVTHVKVEGKSFGRHNGIAEAVIEYKTILGMNSAFDSEAVDENGRRRVTHQHLLGKAAEYVKEKVEEVFDVRSNERNKYVPEKTRKGVLNALLALVATSPQATRLTTNIIQQEREKAYKSLASDKESKARAVRTSIEYNPKEGTAMEDLYKVISQQKAKNN